MRIEIDPVGLAVVAGDPLAERRQPKGLGIADASRLERPCGGGPHARRRGCSRLPDFEVQDVFARAFAQARGAQHVHGQERGDGASVGRAPDWRALVGS